VLLNTAATGAGNVWAMVVAAVSLPLLLHGLGPTEFGLWVLVQTFSAITGWFSLADLGLGIATTRAVAHKASQNDEDGLAGVVSSALCIYVVLGIVSALLLGTVGVAVLPSVFGAPARLRNELEAALLLFAFQALLDLLTAASMACLEGLQRLDLSRATDAIRRTAVAAATTAVALQVGDLRAVAAASLAASAVGTVTGAVLLRRHLSVRLTAPSRLESRGLISYGKSVGLLNATGVLHRTMDRFIVGAVYGPASVTLIEIAIQVQNAASAILAASSYAVIPSAAWLRARGDAGTLRELVERGTKYSLLVTMPLVMGGIVLATPLVHVWVGVRYEDAAGLIAVALVSVAVAAPLQVGSNALQGVGQAGLILRPAAVAVVVNLVSSLILVHVVGVVGVLQGTLIGAAVLTPALARNMLRETGIPAGEFVRRAVAPVVLPTLALAFAAGGIVALPLDARATLIAGALCGAAAYALVATRWSVHRGELRELRDLAIGRA
jgi:O-antigen/teichoic acid export membrane protein